MRVTIDLEDLAEFLSNALGDRTEVVVHDTTQLEKSLCIIKNSISGREVGAPATDLALKLLRECQQESNRPFKTNYPGKTLAGRQLKSSSLVIRNERGEASAMICLNTDDYELQHAVELLRGYFHNEKREEEHDNGHEENFCNSVEHLGDDIINKVLSSYPVTPAHMNSAQKREVVQKLEQNGVFLVKGFIAKTATLLGISEPTLYRYLKETSPESAN